MSRKYLNEKWCVRCGRNDATPYVKKNIGLFKKSHDWKDKIVVDIGCGNGRNTKFMKNEGFENCRAFDMADDFGEKIVLGKDKFPVKDGSVDIILANYILMFLDDKEVDKVLDEMKRISRDGCIAMVELYPAKDSFVKTADECKKFQKRVFDALNWKKIAYAKDRFISIRMD